MGWVWERLRSTSHWNVWKRKFLTLKGSELQIFEMPPVSMQWFLYNNKYIVRQKGNQSDDFTCQQLTFCQPGVNLIRHLQLLLLFTAFILPVWEYSCLSLPLWWDTASRVRWKVAVLACYMLQIMIIDQNVNLMIVCTL